MFLILICAILDIPKWGPDKVSHTQQKRGLSKKKKKITLDIIQSQPEITYLFLQLPQHKILVRRTDGKM